MYAWRKMTDEQRAEILQQRNLLGRPWHRPKHRNAEGADQCLFTAACFEHKPHIGHDSERMADFETRLLDTLNTNCDEIIAWAVLPNHYHALARTSDALKILSELGKLHGRTSFEWNGIEITRGRKVWHSAIETAMKSDGHFWSTLNYVHHNPVKHGYVAKWDDWPFSSAASYLKSVGRDEARRVWKLYPINDYGKGWDD